MTYPPLEPDLWSLELAQPTASLPTYGVTQSVVPFIHAEAFIGRIVTLTYRDRSPADAATLRAHFLGVGTATPFAMLLEALDWFPETLAPLNWYYDAPPEETAQGALVTVVNRIRSRGL